MGKNDSIDYDNLTYGDIFSAIKKLGINICNDEKMLKYQLQNKKKAKYEMGNFCEQYGLPPFAPRQKGKKYDKSHKSYSHKKYKKHKNNFVKSNDFYAKNENVSKQYDKQRTGKGKCFNYGKPGHLSKDCKRKLGKLKNKFNVLNIDDKEQEELESLNQTIRLIPWKMIFLFCLILATNLLIILLILLILKLVVEIPAAIILNLLKLSLKVKKMKN